MYVNNLLRKRGLKLCKKIFRIFVDSFLVFLLLRVFIVIKYSTMYLLDVAVISKPKCCASSHVQTLQQNRRDEVAKHSLNFYDIVYIGYKLAKLYVYELIKLL